MANDEKPIARGQIYKLSEYIANSHLSFDVFGTIQRVFLLSNRMSSVLISVDDDSVIGISASIMSDAKNITPDTNIEVIPYSEWRKEISESFAYDYDRSRFTRSTLLETLRYKVRDHQRYSFVAHKHEEGSGQECVVKYTFISLGKEAKFILATQQEITHNLEHDILTGGLNRAGLMRELQTKIEMNDPTQQLAILFFNIQNFRLINELYGDEVGDKVLQFMYTSIVYSPLCPISYARMESDNFVCLVRKEYFDTDVITQLCNLECSVDHLKIPFRSLCGVYMVKDSLISPVNACNRAKLAMSYISDQYLKPWMVFEDYMQSNYFSDTEILKKFDGAIRDDEFVPYFQPIVEASTGRIVMAEALVRWITPQHGVVTPNIFIPILERHGGLSRIDMMMERKIREMQLRRLANGQPVIPIDINLSWVDFSDDKFVEQIFRHIEDPSLPNNLLRYEITESALSDIADNRRDILSFFKKHNVELLIDDFGQGYSFGTMKDVDFNVIKLDKSLIDHIGQSRKVDFLIETLISMFHKMNAKIVAEGVETDLQVNYLRKVGCDYIQGFYFFKPIDENSFVALLEQQQVALELGQKEENKGKTDTRQKEWVDRDTLEEKYANLEQLVEESKCLRMLLDEQDIHIFEWDVKTHVDTVSEKFRQMYDMPTNQVPNMPEVADLCFEDDRERFRKFYMRAAHGEQMGTDFFRIYTPDGNSYRWYRKTFYTLFDADGFPYKAILSMQDCGDKYNLRLQKSRELMLTKEQDIVTFIYTLPDDKFSFNYLNQQGEVTSRSFSHYLKIFSNNHEGTENLLANIIREKVEETDGPRTGYIDFYNGYTKTEQRAHYSKIDGEFGHLYAIVGQAEDLNRTKERLTETIKSQNELLHLTESLRSIYSGLSYINLKTGVSRIVILDKAYGNTLSTHMDWNTIATIYVDRLIKTKYREDFLKFMDPSTLNERIGNNKYISMEYEDNIIGWSRGSLIPSERDADGNITAVMFAAQAIGAEKSTMERLIYYSEIDSLTQIRNRYSGQREISALLKTGKPGVYGILDCDNFKQINDNYGHKSGDVHLVNIAKSLTKINPNGVNMRLGGDEFSFYIPGNLTHTEIQKLMDDLFESIQAIKIPGMENERLSVSVGAVRINSPEPVDIEEIYHKSDILLYQSKKKEGSALTIEDLKPLYSLFY